MKGPVRIRASCRRRAKASLPERWRRSFAPPEEVGESITALKRGVRQPHHLKAGREMQHHPQTLSGAAIIACDEEHSNKPNRCAMLICLCLVTTCTDTLLERLCTNPVRLLCGGPDLCAILGGPGSVQFVCPSVFSICDPVRLQLQFVDSRRKERKKKRCDLVHKGAQRLLNLMPRAL